LNGTPRFERDWHDVPEQLSGRALEAHLSRREMLLRSAYTVGAVAVAASLPASTILAETATATAKANRLPAPSELPIDHFVILMMENRSFDHYFGWFPGADGSQLQSYEDPQGVSHTTFHAADLGRAQWQGCGHPDPGHGWDAGRAQLRGGFLADGSGNDEFALSYYDDGDLGFVQPAAKAFTLYDRFFCSLLGPTWPNRYYKWSAQSGGRIDNTPPADTLGNQWETIFDRALKNNAANVTSPGMITARYYNSDLPFSAVWGPRGVPWTRPISEYYADCAGGTLPNITIVDPPFRDGGGFDGMSADEHPLGDVRLGQAFMADVVHAFIESPNFRRGALFIIYDEWGGFFDHVRPPSVPDARQSSNLDDDFGQMGFRIPAVCVSPYTLGGNVAHTQLGHESILKLIEYRFGLGSLTTRDQLTNNIGQTFNWRAKPNAEVPDLPRPQHIASQPCSTGGGDVIDADSAHARDIAALADLAERYGFAIGDGAAHELFRQPDSVKQALAASG
jgi:phospholipase C